MRNAIVNHYHKVSGSLVSSSSSSTSYSSYSPYFSYSSYSSYTSYSSPFSYSYFSSYCSSWVDICQHETGIDSHHHLVLHLTKHPR